MTPTKHKLKRPDPGRPTTRENKHGDFAQASHRHALCFPCPEICEKRQLRLLAAPDAAHARGEGRTTSRPRRLGRTSRQQITAPPSWLPCASSSPQRAGGSASLLPVQTCPDRSRPARFPERRHGQHNTCRREANILAESRTNNHSGRIPVQVRTYCFDVSTNSL